MSKWSIEMCGFNIINPYFYLLFTRKWYEFYERLKERVMELDLQKDYKKLKQLAEKIYKEWICE